MPRTQPSQEEVEKRKIVGINSETVTDVTSTDYPGHYFGEDHSWDIEKFRDGLQIEFNEIEPLRASFSLIGVDASIANAFRRIMIADVPTLAIETVFVNTNTSVIQDEVLCHRLGLIPFKAGHEGLDRMKFFKKPADGEEAQYFDYNSISLSLNVKCTHNEEAKAGEKDPRKLYHNAHVYAKDIVFHPIEGWQEEAFAGENAIKPTNPDILIAKLRPGQEIDVTMMMHKGYGWDHAKFSPVATASYRLMPTINILSPIIGDDAKKFVQCFPPGVIGLEKITAKEAAQKGSGYEGHAGELKAVVKNPMLDTVTRECLRHDEFKDKVKLGRRRDHFIYQVESTGQLDSDDIFIQAVRQLKEKARRLEQVQLPKMVR